MRTKCLLGISLIVASLLTGCGGGDSGSSSSSISDELVSITTKEEAVNAFSAVNTIKSMGSSSFTSTTSTSSVSATDSIRLSSKRGRSLAPVNETENCTYGGTMTAIGNEEITSGNEDITSGDVVLTYNNCSQYTGITTNGIQRVTMSSDGSSIEYGIVYTDYKTDSSKISTTSNLTIDSKMELFSGTIDAKMNGSVFFSITDPLDSGTAGYENFRIQAKSSGYVDIEGKVSMNSSINTCANGSFTLDTLEDLHASTNGFDDGKLKVNDVVFEFNTDGTAKVTFADGSTNIIDQNVKTVCN